jgi:hydroxymethylglutaryl-CoA lyase
VEVGPRDGLQNEPRPLAVERRIALIDRLAAAGLRTIESGAFVSRARVPQMADTDLVLAGLRRRPGVSYPVLVPNLRGMDEALAAGADAVAVFASASESFSRANIGCTIQESFERFAPVLERARDAGVPVRGYVSCALGCPYEGSVAPEAVAAAAERLYAMGCEEISLGDTIGAGTPSTARALVAAVAARVPVERLAAHFHDTGGRALDNLLTAMDLGIRVVDASIAGLGGCPYAPGAPGNVATETVVRALEARGVDTGVDPAALAEAAGLARELVTELGEDDRTTRITKTRRAPFPRSS